MDKFIEQIIAINKEANQKCEALETIVAGYEFPSNKNVSPAKVKANFGNLVIMLKGYRMVSEATEAMLSNGGIIKTDNGDYYQKLEVEEAAPHKTFEEHGDDCTDSPDLKENNE